MILNSFLNDHGFWILLLVSLGVESKSRSIQNTFFAITESVVCWIEFPVVFSLFLLPWGVVAVGFSIHSGGAWIIGDKSSSHWVKHFFCALETLRWNTKFDLTALSMLWPLVLSAEPLSKRLSIMRGILVLLDIIKLIGESSKGLSLDNLSNWVRAVSLFSITVVICELFLVLGDTPMLLDFTGFINMALSVFFQMLWGGRCLRWEMHILTDGEVSVLTIANSNNLVSGPTDFRNGVIVNSN
jgi:hypothetical protein